MSGAKVSPVQGLASPATEARVPAPAPPASQASSPAAGATSELLDAVRLRYRVQGPTTRVAALHTPRPTFWQKVAITVFSGAFPPVPLPTQPANLPVVLAAADSQRAYASVTQATYGCSNPAQRGRNFTPKNLREIGLALGDAAPLLRCQNHPVRLIARVDNAVSKTCELVDTVSGHWYFAHQVLTITDSERSMREVTVHEIVHGALQSHDPRTCTNYPDGWTPLLREWRTAMGWSDDGDKIVKKIPGEEPPTEHAAENVWEDMAESVTLYLLEPEKLRSKSKTRFTFAERIVRELRELGVAV